MIKKILILTSETGAAYQDFIFALENANCNIDIELIDVIVQGVDCPGNICIELEKVKKSGDEYDLVVLTRGGGSFQDLFGFSQPELIETIYNFNLPIISAIGHQIDNPLSDLVCDFSAPTPSLAAQFIIDYNKHYLKRLHKIKQSLFEQLNIYAINYLEKLNVYTNNINRKWTEFQNKQKNQMINELQNMLRKLDSYENRLESFKSKDLMIVSNGKILKNEEELYNCKEKTLEIVWNNVLVKVKVEKYSYLKE
jgi:exodeoxyribonuclease VII large subunit